MGNLCFRHAGIVPDDPEAIAWAACQKADQCSDFSSACSQRIRLGDAKFCMDIDGRHFEVVFTDGSVHGNRSKWLRYGGWGMFVNDNSTANCHGGIDGKPVTTYRAEARGVLQAILSADTSLCIVYDNQTVVNTLGKILADGGRECVWPLEDGCASY